MEKLNKVISLELAKQIDVEHKRLGIEVESEWYWVEVIPSDNPHTWEGSTKPLRSWKINLGTPCGRYEDGVFQGEEKYYPAYDVAELGEMMKNIELAGDYSFDIGFNHCQIIDISDFCIAHEFDDSTEAEARGKMYIWLLKEGYINGKA